MGRLPTFKHIPKRRTLTEMAFFVVVVIAVFPQLSVNFFSTVIFLFVCINVKEKSTSMQTCQSQHHSDFLRIRCAKSFDVTSHPDLIRLEMFQQPKNINSVSGNCA